MSEADRERDDFAAFAGRNRARLLSAYDSVRAGRIMFCWPGLLFPQAWFLYRKMYVWAALVTVGPLALANLPAFSYLDWFASILGALGLRFYVADARRTIARLRGAGAESRIARAGGVSEVGACVGLVYIFAVFVMTLKSGPVAILRLP